LGAYPSEHSSRASLFANVNLDDATFTRSGPGGADPSAPEPQRPPTGRAIRDREALRVAT